MVMTFSPMVKRVHPSSSSSRHRSRAVDFQPNYPKVESPIATTKPTTILLSKPSSSSETFANPTATAATTKIKTTTTTRIVGETNVDEVVEIDNDDTLHFITGTAESTTDTTALDTEIETTPAVSIRRKYETFAWKYSNNNHDNDTDNDVFREYNINYRVEGPIDGPPILLIHGFGANIGHYRYQFPALVDEGYRVYAIDMLGFGASDKPGNVNYCMELYVQLLSDFIQAMDAKDGRQQKKQKTNDKKKWIVAGNSIGGLCSLGVAQAIPELVRAVILFNCSGGMTGFRYPDVPLYIRPFLWLLQKVVLGEQFGGRFFAHFKTRANVESILKAQGVYRNQTNVDEELLAMLLEPADDEGAEVVFLKTFAGPPGPTPESILPNLSCPVLAIWGGADPWTPVNSGPHPGTEFHRFSGDRFELVILPGVGHCPHDEAPEQVHSYMIPWMKSLDYNG